QGMTPSRAPGPAPGVSAAPGAVGGTPGLAAAPDLAVPATAAQAALLVENRRLRRVDIERRAWLTFLAEAGELLAQSLDVELTLALIPRLIVPRLGRWCTVHTAGPSGDLQLAAATHTEEDQLSGLLTQFETTAEVLRDALRTESAVALAAPADGYAVPLIARSQLLGCLTVGRGTATWPHTDEVAIIEDVARRAALAIDNARIHADLKDVASQLQRSLLPPPLPKVTGIEFGAEYLPAGKGVDVGGDFYDVIELAQDRWLVMVGDVSGKGVPVATITGLVRDVTRVLVRDGRSLPEVLSRLNETLVDRGAGRFCTVAFAEVTRPQSGVLAIRLYLAGHHQPVHVQVDGQATLVGECGTALGLLETVRSPESRITLGPGETLVLYTDGVTECRRGEELFGQERLRDHAAALAGFPAEVVAARLLTAALGFSRESPLDDIALLVIRNDSSHLP
ncbi:MAG: SpoIIE family protein phosphatase, partial [Micromonosporaceae bacterium]|nr:SpoIIE family protein phosphatase [Micromonosporaceae bacterium]